ncbi:hypothetical protein BC938DRAFT_471923 [Jimgerdemannia flammicorona]|uniref:Uncharacterized protein n=1 Tax=Jimgerdemannia flammicorona TaxID=994334 RepID=A0A433Q737_9FUNG|nr:hypothetical protein BC938DRAFT_471923 [Jimgerdemannia flammicorona]
MASAIANATHAIHTHSMLACPDYTGLLTYPPYNDFNDHLPDFSYAGYNNGFNNLPTNIPVTAFLQPCSVDDPTDDSDRIQLLIDYISALPLTASGFRGALQLSRGTFHLSKTINIQSSGVVIQGDPKGGTHIEVTADPRQFTHLINIEGLPNEPVNARSDVLDEYVPVGGSHVRVAKPELFRSGDHVIVSANFNEEWLHAIGMDYIPSKGDPTKNVRWRPGHFDSFRIVREVDLETGIVALNAPLTVAIAKRWGSGFMRKYIDRRISRVGVQNLAFTLPFNKDRTPDDIMRDEGPTGKKDYRFAGEMFKGYLVRMENAEDCWIQRVSTTWFRNFVRLLGGAISTTIQNCHHLFPQPPPPPTQPRRQPYLCGQSAYELGGQLTLVSHCHADHSMHAYVYMARVPGPNVVHACTASGRMGDVGPHMKWCHGWSGANCLIWNSKVGSGIVVQKPPTAHNFAVGSTDKRGKVRMPDHEWGWWESPDVPVWPDSLYLRQLEERTSRSRHDFKH